MNVRIKPNAHSLSGISLSALIRLANAISHLVNETELHHTHQRAGKVTAWDINLHSIERYDMH